LEKAESCAGGPPETINCLIGIAYGKQVAFLASQQAQDLNLSEVCVLELVDQDKASALPFVRKQWRILAKELVGSRDHVPERPQILFGEHAFYGREDRRDLPAAA